MAQQDKLSKAAETLKGQSQQDEPKRPADIEVVGSAEGDGTQKPQSGRSGKPA